MAGTMVESGRLNKRLTIQRLKTAALKDAAGHTDPLNGDNWETYTTVWAEMVSQGSREFQRAKQTQANLSNLWRVRYSSTAAAITTAMRITWSDGGTSRTEQVANPPQHEDGNHRMMMFGAIESK
jgi:SPP1 family predicted phage head-tail adaptor